jgi:large repetitive protein
MLSIRIRTHGAPGTGLALRTRLAPWIPARTPGRSGPLGVVAGVLSVLLTAACTESPTAPVDPISIDSPTLAEGIEGVAYGQQLTASGGSGPYSWVLAAGSLPGGLTLAPSGAISGTPVAPGTSNFRIRATDARGQTATAELAISVVQTLTVHTWTLPEGVAGVPYSVDLQAVGGRGTRTWSVAGGEAASWLSISPTGRLSGAPPASGVATVTVFVADESGQQNTRPFSLVILDPVAVAAMVLPVATQGRIYAAQLVASGGDGVFAWELAEGALPPGLSLGTVGDLRGTPTHAGNYALGLRVTDRGGRVATGTVTLTVEAAPTIQTAILPPGEPGIPYAAQLLATGGTTPYTWSLTGGTLPAGLTLSAAGVLSGTPAALGSATFTVQVTDGAGASHARTFAMEVAPVVALASKVPLAGIGGEAGEVRYFSIEVPPGATRFTVTLSGGSGDADLYVRRGALPAPFAYDCRPFREGNEEICTFTPPFLAPGPWYIMLRGHTAYGDVRLEASHDG